MATSKVEEKEKLNTVSDKEWTPEQQVQELTKRFEVIYSFMKFEKSSFSPNPDDVILAVPPKNGATWMLHICHQIRMGGAEPDFDDQAQVMTWMEASKTLLGYANPADRPQPAKPMLFLTHLPYSDIPLGGRRICCFRDQKDAIISAYHFLNSLLCLRGRVSLSIFANLWTRATELRLKDLLTWWEHRHDDNLLLVFFDDLKEDHAGCVRRIAKHMGVDCDEDTIARVVHTTSHAEMSKIGSKFSSRQLAQIIADKLGESMTPESEYVSRVRKGGGRSGDGQKLPPEIIAYVDQLWQEIVTPKLGFKDLKEMREARKKEQSAN